MATDTPSTFKKPNTALVMMPKVGKLTAMSRKLLNSMFHFAQKHLQSLPDGGASFNAMDFFEEDLVDVIRPIGNPKSNSLSMMKDHIMEMQAVRVDWTAPDQTQGVIWDSMVLVSQAKLKIENGRVRMLWSFPPDIVRSLANPEFYTVIRLQELALLKSYVAVALYEIAVRYSTSPTNLTSVKPKEWWVAALSNDSHKRSLKEKLEPVLRDWRMFKHEKVMPAIEEINSKTGLKIELIETKKGRAVSDVQFSVRRVVDADKTVKEEKTGPCYVKAAQLGIPQREITSFLERTIDPYTEEQVLLAMAKVERQMSKSRDKPIENIVTYFRSVMRDTAIPPLFQFPSDTQPSNTQQSKNLSSLPVLSVLDPKALITDMPHLEVILTKRSRIAKEFQSLEMDQQLIYVNGARERLKAKGLLTPSMARRIDAGSWTSGVIFDEVLTGYGLEFHGQNWNVDDGADLPNAMQPSEAAPATSCSV